MIVDFEFKTGLVFGLEADTIFMMDEEENLDEEPSNVIYLHLGILTIAIIFEK